MASCRKLVRFVLGCCFDASSIFLTRAKILHPNLRRLLGPNTWQRYDTQHNDTQHNDTQHNDTHHNDTQQNNTQHIDVLHNHKQNVTLIILAEHCYSECHFC